MKIAQSEEHSSCGMIKKLLKREVNCGWRREVICNNDPAEVGKSGKKPPHNVKAANVGNDVVGIA